MLNKLKHSWIQILWIMLISLVCLLTFISGKFSYKQFLGNEITEINRTALVKPQDGTIVIEGNYQLTEDMAVFRYKLPIVGTYKFLEVELQGLTADELPVLYYGEYKGEQEDVQNFVLREGNNYIYLGEKKIDKIVMAIGGKKDTVFSIGKIKLDENIPRSSTKKSIVLYLLILCLVSALFKLAKPMCNFVCRGVWIKPEGNVMEVYSNIVESFAFSRDRFFFNSKQKIYLRRGIFGLLIAYMLVISEAVQLTKEYYSCHVLIISLVLILQSFLYYEKEGRPVIWNKKVCTPYLCLAVWICIANGMAYKSMYSGAGWFMILVVLLFGYSISTVGQPNIVLRDISYAMAGTYLLVLILSVFLRPCQKGTVYTGIFRTPEYFAEYLILLLFVFQFLYSDIGNNKKKEIILCIGIVSTELLLIGTHQRLYILISLVSLVCWKMYQHKSGVPLGKILLSFFSAACLLFVVENFAGWIHLDEIWKNNQLEPRRDFLYNGIRESFRTFIMEFQQQCQIWLAYLRKINLFGHDASLSLAGKRVRPGNVWISIIYKYGIFSIVFYVVLTARCLYFGICRWKSGKSYGEYFLLELQAACCILAFYSNFEMPFVTFLWVMFCLGIGFYLTESV